MSEFSKIELGNLAKIKGGKRLPKGASLTDVPNSHPYIRTRDINNHKVVFQDLLYVPDDIFPSISRYTVNEGDVIISIVGTIGLCSIIPSELNLANLTENCAKIVEIDKARLLPQYLYYYLISEEGQFEIRIRNVGSTQPKLPLYNIKALPIPLPPLPEQRAIAGVLSSLGDKIDLLHRENETLEALAETLFRQWFIEEAEDDWEEGVLGDLIKLEYGKGLKKSIRTGTGFPVVGSSGIIDHHSDYLVEGPGIVIGRKGTLGEVIYLSENFYPIDTTFYIKTKSFSPNLYFEKFLVSSMNFQNMNTDSAVPGLNRNLAESIKISIPPQTKITRFNEMVDPFFQKQISNNNQIYTLENLRDTLLPKLMSGEVRMRIRDSKKAIV
jgi:type I restriction enzyme S subunit